MVYTRATTSRAGKLQWFTKPDAQHLVQFYDHEGMLMACLLEYVSTGLRQGATCMVVATPKVLISLQKNLRAQGINVAEALATGLYQAYDAEELLTQLMDGRSVSDDKFRQEVGTLVTANTAQGQTLRVYCEMVGLLLREQNSKAALQAEREWDKLIAEQPFSLYCAYPMSTEPGTDYQSCHPTWTSVQYS